MTTLDAPACWTWELPPLPQPNGRGRLERWQDGRCALCGKRPLQLHEDHDHATGYTRGYLCPSCNASEPYGLTPRFLNYRARPPVAIIGVSIVYGRLSDPADEAAAKAWRGALWKLRHLARPREVVEARQDQNILYRLGLVPEPWAPPERTQLMADAERVGLTLDEWNGTLAYRQQRRIDPKAIRHRPQVVRRDAAVSVPRGATT